MPPESTHEGVTSDGAIAAAPLAGAAGEEQRGRRGPPWTNPLLVAAMAAVVVAAAGMLHGGRADTALLLHLNHWRGLPDVAWATLGVAGYGVCVLAIASVLARNSPLMVAALLWFTAVGGGATHLVKRAFPTPRPTLQLGPDALYLIGDTLWKRSMPSGHTVAAAGVVAIACLVGGPAWRRPSVVAIAVLVALGVGLSRIATGAHWPSDVLAGYAIGAASGYASVCLARWSRLDAALASTAGRWLVAVVQLGSAVAVLATDTDGLDGRMLQGILAGTAFAAGALSLFALLRSRSGDATEARR